MPIGYYHLDISVFMKKKVRPYEILSIVSLLVLFVGFYLFVANVSRNDIFAIIGGVMFLVSFVALLVAIVFITKNKLKE